jgi:hypothetical protein
MELVAYGFVHLISLINSSPLSLTLLFVPSSSGLSLAHFVDHVIATMQKAKHLQRLALLQSR